MPTIRKGTAADLPQIAAIYNRIHAQEEAGLVSIGWIRGVYPTEDTARSTLEADELFVLEENGVGRSGPHQPGASPGVRPGQLGLSQGPRGADHGAAHLGCRPPAKRTGTGQRICPLL